MSGLPRELAPGVFWLGDCLHLPYQGRTVHAYHSPYLVVGEDACAVVDSGHMKDWRTIERQLDEVLARGAPPVRWLFPTHSETPHSNGMGRLLEKFPESVVWGDVRDYHLVFPEYVDRLVPARVGDETGLGGTRLVLLEAVVRDLVTSLWAYDTRSRTLFPGDGFAYVHHHEEGECGKTAEEIEGLPVPEYTAVFAEVALYWTRFTDVEPHIRRLDAVLGDPRFPVDVVAPGHGCPVVDPTVTAEKVKEGMRLGAGSAVAAGWHHNEQRFV